MNTMQPTDRSASVAPFKWKPGQSGNPAGRRKGSVSLASALQKLLLKEPDKLESVARTLVDAAIAGDVSAARLFIRAFGRSQGNGIFCRQH